MQIDGPKQIYAIMQIKGFIKKIMQIKCFRSKSCNTYCIYGHDANRKKKREIMQTMLFTFLPEKEYLFAPPIPKLNLNT